MSRAVPTSSPWFVGEANLRRRWGLLRAYSQNELVWRWLLEPDFYLLRVIGDQDPKLQSVSGHAHDLPDFRP